MLCLEEAQIYEEGLLIFRCKLYARASHTFPAFWSCLSLSSCFNEMICYITQQLYSQYKVYLWLCLCWRFSTEMQSSWPETCCPFPRCLPSSLRILGLSDEPVEHSGVSIFWPKSFSHVDIMKWSLQEQLLKGGNGNVRVEFSSPQTWSMLLYCLGGEEGLAFLFTREIISHVLQLHIKTPWGVLRNTCMWGLWAWEDFSRFSSDCTLIQHYWEKRYLWVYFEIHGASLGARPGSSNLWSSW